MYKMKYLFRSLILLALASCTMVCGAQEHRAIIPHPQEMTWADGAFTLRSNTRLCCSPDLAEQASILSEQLFASTGYDLKVEQMSLADFGKLKSRSANFIGLFSTSVLAGESYYVHVEPNCILLESATPAGGFYATQTLLQLLPSQVMDSHLHRPCNLPEGQWMVPCVSISDAPQRPWRGLMLDVARYFHDLRFLRHYIDCMAHYKLNRLQLHLIDDSGWRLEIKKYPRLTEQGAWAGPQEKRLGGYYTQEEMRELISYAAARGVEIVPEIEFPAHILSAVVAYPWLSCTGEQHELPTKHFISPDLLCVGKQSSLDFLRDVMDEVCALFPSPYVNIGGDEAVYKRWEACPDCQALMKKEGLEKASDLQGWLTNQVAEMLRQRGRTAVGWEEIVQRGKVEQQVVATIWHNINDTLQVKQLGHKALLSPNTHLYLDFPECNTPGEVPAATWRPHIPLRKVYEMPCEDYSESGAVIGLQACMWSDLFIHGDRLQEYGLLNENRSETYIDYLTFPRLLAVSEVAWCKKQDRSWQRFSEAMSLHYSRLGYMGVHYRVQEPIVQVDGEIVTLISPDETAQIRYTLDGSYPHEHSPLYAAPITLSEGQTLRAITIAGPGHYSLPATYSRQ